MEIKTKFNIGDIVYDGRVNHPRPLNIEWIRLEVRQFYTRVTYICSDGKQRVQIREEDLR